MRSNHRHKIRFQVIVYLKLTKWGSKILKNINIKNLTWCVKLIRKQEIIIISLQRDKSRENWIVQNELIIDFGEQNETE